MKRSSFFLLPVLLSLLTGVHCLNAHPITNPAPDAGDLTRLPIPPDTGDPTGNPIMGYIPTPQTWAFMKYADAESSNLYTGTAREEIPVYVYKDEDFTIPVSLGYATNGMLPSMQTGIAGLGWFLNTGGVITREIRGQADEYTVKTENSSAAPESRTYNPEKIMTFKTPAQNGSTIKESATDADIFHFKFMGQTGSFSLNEEGDIVVHDTPIGYGTNTIKLLVQQTTPSEIIITTGDGTKYTFGGEEPYLETLLSGNYGVDNGNFQFLYVKSPITVVSWYLREITAPNGRKVTFEYSNGNLPAIDYGIINAGSQYTNFVMAFQQAVNCLNYIEGPTIYKKPTTIKTTYLTKIAIDDKAEICLTYSNKQDAELDADAASYYMNSVQKLQKLDAIRVVSKFGNKNLLTCALSYKRFYQRLLLDKVNISGKGDYKMDYYLEHPLPGITSNSVDFWGYYNGRSSSDDAFFKTLGVDDSMNEYLNANSTSKMPDGAFAKTGCLKSIVYPMGGIRRFEYEPHTAQWGVFRRREPSEYSSFKGAFCPKLYPYSVMFAQPECGGVRLCKITDDDQKGGVSVTEYAYTEEDGTRSGVVTSFPRFCINKLSGNYSYAKGVQIAEQTFDQSHTEYGAVLVRRSDGSSVRNCYTTYRTHPDDYEGQVSKPQSDPASSDCDTAFLNNIFRMPNSNLTRRGKPTQEIGRDQSNKIVSRKIYTYGAFDINGGDGYSTSAINSSYGHYNDAWCKNSFMLTGKYDIRYSGADSLFVRHQITYLDSGLPYMVSKQEADGTIQTQKMTYEWAGNGTLLGVWLLYPKEESLFHTKRHQSGYLRDYVISQRNYSYYSDYKDPYKDSYRLLESERDLLVDEPKDPELFDNNYYFTNPDNWVAVRTITKYNNQFRPVEEHGADNVPVCHVWGYGGLYIVAEVRNVSLDQVRSVFGLGDIDKNPLPEALNDTQNAALRNLPGAEVTSYKYEPFVGKTEEMDSSVRKISYGYNQNGKLISVSDTDGDPIKEYTYSIN